MTTSRPIDPRVVAHHVGARGYGVSFNVPKQFRNDVVHVLYEADRECVERMLKDTDSAHSRMLAERHVFPYCLGRVDGSATLNITANAYASSLLQPNPDFQRYYCEIPIDAGTYDVTYPDMMQVLRRVDVEIRSLDGLFRDGTIPANLRPDFLSIDTQGYELEILEGAARAVSDGVVGIVCEVEMLPIYVGQPLLGDILTYMTQQQFLFAGFTAMFEVAPLRAPVGLRGKSFPGFGDALFLRDLEKLDVEALGPDRAFVMFHKAAFIALCFGHVEYALDALGRAGRLRSRVDRASQDQLGELRYVEFLHDVAQLSARQPSMYPPVHAVPDNSRQPGDERTSWYDKHHRASMDLLLGKGPRGLLYTQFARNVRHLLPGFIKRPLRRLLLGEASPAVSSATSDLKSSPSAAAAAGSEQSSQQVAPGHAADWGPMQEFSEFEKLLDRAGFAVVMQAVRERRLNAERYLRSLSPEMYRDGALVHLPRATSVRARS
jgi:FkbM family methyltransferase